MNDPIELRIAAKVLRQQLKMLMDAYDDMGILRRILCGPSYTCTRRTLLMLIVGLEADADRLEREKV